ncbi:MAG: hypothetical protein J5589_05410 [Firmicutes bacterium]|nr:hypothetical protein [Bacillota bacterium]
MLPYRHFSLASYMFAYYTAKVTDDEIRDGVEWYLKYVPLKKIYVENHRSTVDVPVSRLREIKAILEEYGLKVSGGITSTALVDDIQKPTIFDTFCYTDPRHRETYLAIVRDAASVFDEIILDDFFFTSCRCEMCIRAKGKKSWKDFRQEQMLDFSKEIVAEARRINPKMNFIIKYPNWYESYHECGYVPMMQRDVFDMVYTGTETREPFYAAQHLQRYESYSLMRLIENTVPGRNGGGWIDLGGSSDNISVWLEQAEFSFLGGAKELTLFNFPGLLRHPALTAMDPVLRRVDDFLDQAGSPFGTAQNSGPVGTAKASGPVGTAVWEPFDATGEDQLASYLGMCGAALELKPEFPENAPTVLFTSRTACMPDAMEKLEAFVREGGNAVVTVGFVHEMYEKGIKDMTSVRLTHRHVLGNEYMIDRVDHDYSGIRYAKGAEKVMFEVLDYKTNATWADILLLTGEDNFPVLTEDYYGKGRFFILNVPENFADLYKLPAEVIQTLNAILSLGQEVYLGSAPKASLITYENQTLCLHSFRPMLSSLRVVVRGECKGLQDLESGREYTQGILLPGPQKRGDGARTRTAPPEYAFDIPVGPGRSIYLKVVR